MYKRQVLVNNYVNNNNSSGGGNGYNGGGGGKTSGISVGTRPPEHFLDGVFGNLLKDPVKLPRSVRRKAKKMLASKQTFGDKGQFTPLGWFVFEMGELDMCSALLACGGKVHEPTSELRLLRVRLACEKGRARGPPRLPTTGRQRASTLEVTPPDDMAIETALEIIRAEVLAELTRVANAHASLLDGLGLKELL